MSYIQSLQKYKKIALKLLDVDFSVKEWLVKNDYKNVVIYGMGKLGKALVQKINDTVNIACCIDKNEGCFLNFNIVSIEKFNSSDYPCDLIIITPYNDFESIRNLFKFSVQNKCLSIENLGEKIVKVRSNYNVLPCTKEEISSPPKVSVVMPIYNAEKFIEKTIRCILNQTFKNFELLLINDHPTDRTMEIIKSIKDSRIRIIENERNMGISYSRNQGLNHAVGKYIALMDDDDLAPLNRFEIEVDFLDNHNEIDVVSGSWTEIDENDNVLAFSGSMTQDPMQVRAQFLFCDTVGNGSAMFRTDFINKNNIRYFDNCYGMEDFRFWVECSAKGKIVELNDILLNWRQSSCNETTKVKTKLTKERKNKFAEIQKTALALNGFVLTDEELKIFTDVFTEDYSEKKSFEDLAKIIFVIPVLTKILEQAKNSNLENYIELKSILRDKIFDKISMLDFFKD
ncbi:MAG: glycosyltransferase family 2 protein [Treponemataceae bacterium]